jgi:hypothetical protein
VSFQGFWLLVCKVLVRLQVLLRLFLVFVLIFGGGLMLAVWLLVRLLFSNFGRPRF